jgi:hypothetical protein
MVSKKIIMSKFKYLLIVSCFLCMLNIHAQNTPSLIIDSSEMQFSDVSLPYWLKAGQTVDLGRNAKKASIIEFTLNNSNLDFSRVFSLINKQTVPSNKVWKIEGIGLKLSDTSLYTGSTLIIGGGSSSSNTSLPSIFQSPIKYETPGTYSWKVPPGITKICVELWGGGGGGPGVNLANHHSAGGGGGGYGYGCYTVVPGTSYTVTVGGGGGAPSPPVGPAQDGGTSSVGNLIYATGGKAGSGPSTNTSCSGVAGGAGGTSNGTFVINGQNGTNSQPCSALSGSGGNGGNGGNGGGSISSQGTGIGGQFPSGGGSGSINSTSATLRLGGAGASGKVIIYF